MFFRRKKPKGFTLVELIVATVIFAICMVTIGASTINFYRGYKRQLARDALYEETRVLIDRIAQEVRNNTVDFDEYFNRSDFNDGKASTEYGAYYREYWKNFQYVQLMEAPCEQYDLNDPRHYAFDPEDPCYPSGDLEESFFSTGANSDTGDDHPEYSALDSAAVGGAQKEQSELYLIDATGKQKTIIKTIPNGINDDRTGGTDDGGLNDTGKEQVGILKLELADQYDNESFTGGGTLTPDADGDGYYDCWANAPDFLGWEFIAISPPSIEVKELQFFITPVDDPFKATAEDDVNVQAQPSVTIRLTTQVSQDTLRKFYSENPPSVTLETTVSSRIYTDVEIPFDWDGSGGTGECFGSGGGGGGGAGAVCGDGNVDAGEECDGSNLNGITSCRDIAGERYVSGTPTCNGDCTLNTSGCGYTGGSCTHSTYPTCYGASATVCVVNGTIVGGSQDGQAYAGTIQNGNPNTDVITGTDGNDTLRGGNKDDVICGFGGDDYIYGGQNGGTSIYGEILFGGSGADHIYGDQGDDDIYGEDGDDYIEGDQGNDTIDGGNGTDTINGGSGSNDTCINGETVSNCEH